MAARKPVQSFAPGGSEPTDADLLARSTGEPSDDVCPAHRRLPMAVAPPMAAAELGLPAFTIAELVTEVRISLPVDHRDIIVVVEGAGGARSPIAEDGDTVALAHALAADRVVIVADAGLGTINGAAHGRRTVELDTRRRAQPLRRRQRTPPRESRVARRTRRLLRRDEPESARRRAHTPRSASRPIVRPGRDATRLAASSTPGMNDERS